MPGDAALVDAYATQIMNSKIAIEHVGECEEEEDDDEEEEEDEEDEDEEDDDDYDGEYDEETNSRYVLHLMLHLFMVVDWPTI